MSAVPKDFWPEAHRPAATARELLEASAWWVRPCQHPIARATRRSELRLLLVEAQAEWDSWPSQVQALGWLLHSVAQGRRDVIPAAALSGALDARWPASAAQQGRV